MIRKTLILLSILIIANLQALSPDEIYELHQRLDTQWDAASPLYGYCAWRSGLITRLCAFAPDDSALGKLTRMLFFIQPWDGVTIVTQNPRSVALHITPAVWGKIVGMLMQTSTEKLSLDELETLIEKEVGWEKLCAEAKIQEKKILAQDAEYTKLGIEIDALQKELASLNGKLGAAARRRRAEIASEATELKRKREKSRENLPREMRSALESCARDPRSIHKLAEALFGSLAECNNAAEPKNIWPHNLIYTVITALIEQIAQSADDVRAYYAELATDAYDSKKTVEAYTQISLENLSQQAFTALLAKDPARLALSMIEKSQSGIVDTVPYRKDVPAGDFTFSDCTEIAILNLINWIAYNPTTKKISIEQLEGATPKTTINPAVKAFYEKYPTPSAQKSLAAHREWAKILSNLPHATYGRPTGYELNTDETSVLRAIAQCIFYKTLPEDAPPKQILQSLATLITKRDPTLKLSYKQDTAKSWTLTATSNTHLRYLVATAQHATFLQLALGMSIASYIVTMLSSGSYSESTVQLLSALLCLEKQTAAQPLTGPQSVQLLLLIHFVGLESPDTLKACLKLLAKSPKLEKSPLLHEVQLIIRRAFLANPQMRDDDSLKNHIISALPKDPPPALLQALELTIDGKSVLSVLKRL